MSHAIPAVFSAGVFRPLELVDVAEGTPVTVQLETAAASITNEANEATKRAWRDFVDRMESLPDQSPDDGLTNRDHDRVIYGY